MAKKAKVDSVFAERTITNIMKAEFAGQMVVAGIENEPDACLVREPSEECRTDAALTEHETEENAGNHPDPSPIWVRVGLVNSPF